MTIKLAHNLLQFEHLFAIIKLDKCSKGVIVVATKPALSKIAFIRKYSSDEACEQLLFHLKWPNGFVCERCEHPHCYIISTRNHKLYQCKECGYQSTVTVGTVFEKTRTPLSKWFLAIYCIASDKRGLSAVQLMDDIEVSYPTAWLMLHKIRAAMSERDTTYMLEGIVEMDDTYIGAKDEGGKRGRGTDKTKVVVALSLGAVDNPLYVKMQVTPDIKGESLRAFALENIVEGSTIRSDSFRSYNILEKEYTHEPEPFNPVENGEHRGWLHVIVSNLKSFIDGTYHGLDKKHLQNYINEFCYRFNRRLFKRQGFYRLLDCCINCRTMTYSELTL